MRSWERLLADVRAELGDDVHVLVNNAARTEFRTFWEIDDAASKAAIVALTRCAATELAAHGVTVNAIAPAAIDGPLARSLPPKQLAAMTEPPSPSAGWAARRRSLVCARQHVPSITMCTV